MSGSFREYPKLLEPKKMSKGHQTGCLTPILYGLSGHDVVYAGCMEPSIENPETFYKVMRVFIGGGIRPLWNPA